MRKLIPCMLLALCATNALAAPVARIRIEDPYAAAAAFLGALHSFVFLSEVAGAFEEDVSMDRFLDTVLAVWMHGVASEARPAKKKRRKA